MEDQKIVELYWERAEDAIRLTVLEKESRRNVTKKSVIDTLFFICITDPEGRVHLCIF